MKKTLLAIVILFGLFHATPAFAASKKVDRLQILSDKATIETTYKKSIEAAKTEFTTAIKSTKKLKGKEKSAAIKAATTKQQKAAAEAKEVRKKQLKELTTKK